MLRVHISVLKPYKQRYGSALHSKRRVFWTFKLQFCIMVAWHFWGVKAMKHDVSRLQEGSSHQEQIMSFSAAAPLCDDETSITCCSVHNKLLPRAALKTSALRSQFAGLPDLQFQCYCHFVWIAVTQCGHGLIDPIGPFCWAINTLQTAGDSGYRSYQ